MTGYTKLFGSILESTVWLETPQTKVVWITLLAMADRDGIIEASVPGLAKRAGVDRIYCEQALAVFLSPDPDSRTKDFDGRRIEPVEGGWRLLNYEVYRQRASKEEAAAKNALRQKRYRDRALRVTPVTDNNTIAEAEAEADTEAEATTTKSSSPLVVSPLRYEKLKQTHAFVGSRLRVPNVLHEELRTKCGRDGETKLQGWYLILNEQLETSGDALPDVFQWLRPRFIAWCETEGLVKAPPKKADTKHLPYVTDDQSAELQQAIDIRRRRAEMLEQGMDPQAIEAIFEQEYEARRSAKETA